MVCIEYAKKWGSERAGSGGTAIEMMMVMDFRHAHVASRAYDRYGKYDEVA